ncbi:MAG: tetratricopeptide repeat protein, partial [Candidatus Omnitrophota bacterium]
MRARLLLLGVCLVIFAAPANSDNSSQQALYRSDTGPAGALFSQGNGYYAQEKFDQAITAYEQELSLGRESGPLYYNLGNAYFKSGQLGRAILNYLRAERLIPAD